MSPWYVFSMLVTQPLTHRCTRDARFCLLGSTSTYCTFYETLRIRLGQGNPCPANDCSHKPNHFLYLPQPHFMANPNKTIPLYIPNCRAGREPKTYQWWHIASGRTRMLLRFYGKIYGTDWCEHRIYVH